MATPKRNNWLAITLLTVICWFAGTSTHVSAAAPGSITLTPATMTLTLAAGSTSAQSSFHISNNYSTPITLHLSFIQPIATPGVQSALKNLSVSPTDVTIPAASSVSPQITVNDSSTLAPGSQQISLAITEETTPGSNISIVAGINMPLIVIKESGAVEALSVANLKKPNVSISLPTTASLTVRNTGNIITVPRGYVTLTDPRGEVVSKGVLNTTSTAVAPKQQISLQVPLTKLVHARALGTYHLTVTYDNGLKAVTTSFVYIPKWGLFIVVPIGALAYICYLIWVEWKTRKRADKEPPNPPQSSMKEEKVI